MENLKTEEDRPPPKSPKRPVDSQQILKRMNRQKKLKAAPQ